MAKEKNTKSVKNTPRMILGALFVMVFILGWILGHQDAKFGKFGYSPTITGRDGGKNVDFGVFWRTWELLEKKYDGKVDYEKMVYGAVKGMVESLGDPYTSFLSPDEAKSLSDDLSGVVSGIGAEIGIKNNQLTIIAPLDDSPAKKAGLVSGDWITQINGETTVGMDVNVAVSKIRGDAGTKVKLKVRRGNTEKEYEIARARVIVKSVRSEIKTGNIGYIEITKFDDKTTEELRKVLESFVSKNVTKVVIDLRNNPGGYLDQSVTVSSEFIRKGVVVAEKREIDGTGRMEYKATGNGKMTDPKIKIIVLVNEGSASAAEIVAGALKDHGRAKLVGKKTFGKGSVQEIEDLSRGAKLRVTVAHWYTPNGKNIGKEGIAPDYDVELTESDYNNNRDPQLERAIELLKN